MILKSLSLLNYKNFEAYTVQFNSKINCFVGSNGVGKTNVLDAIYHLSFGKSYFNPIASQNIKHNEDFFVVDGIYEKNDRDEKIIVSLKPAIVITKAYRTAALLKTPTNESSTYRNVKYLGNESKWGFNKADQKNVSIPIHIGIKFKL